MAAHEDVWRNLDALSTALDGDRIRSEQTLDALLAELKSKPRAVRDERRRQMILTVAALSRLEVRMIDADGPLAS